MILFLNGQNHICSCGPKHYFCRDFNGFVKIAAICPYFKWLGFQISDPIQKLDHLQPNLFLANQKSRLVKISDPHCI